jgi:hypothetical protein
LSEELEEKLEETRRALKESKGLTDRTLSDNLKMHCAHDKIYYKFEKYQEAYYERSAVIKNYRKVIKNYEKFNCEKCHASFSSSESLESHKLVHNTPFDVPTEEMQFLETKYSELIMECQTLREKLRRQNKIIQDRKLSCTKCDATFALHSTLLVHQYWHQSGLRCPDLSTMQLEVNHSRLKEDYQLLTKKCEGLEERNNLSQTKVNY